MSTISKVAERAGVSRTTVSHVLNHADRVTPALRQRVLEAIKEMGYTPNPQAQSLRTGRTNIVALLVTGDMRNPFFPELLIAAQGALERAGLGMMVFNNDADGPTARERGRDYVRQIRGRRVDGLIISDFGLHQMHEDVREIGIPSVFLGDLPGASVDSVKIDDFGGGRLLGRYLADRGHTRVAHVAGPALFSEAKARADGFEQGLADGGAPQDPALRYEGTYRPLSGEEAVDWLVATHRGNMPSVIYFANHQMATAGLARLHDHGIAVPRDIAVAAFGDMDAMTYVRPRLTRVGVAPAALAERACALLLDRLNGGYAGAPRAETLQCALKGLESA